MSFPTCLLEPGIRRLHSVSSIFRNFEFETQLFINPEKIEDYENAEFYTGSFAGNFQKLHTVRTRQKFIIIFNRLKFFVRCSRERQSAGEQSHLRPRGGSVQGIRWSLPVQGLKWRFCNIMILMIKYFMLCRVSY